MDAAELYSIAAETAARRRTDAARRELLGQAANLSLEIENDFRTNGIIKFITASAHASSVDAFEKLAEIDATNVEGIRELQNTIQRYSGMLDWLYRALQQGETARKELDGATIAAMDETFTIREGEDG